MFVMAGSIDERNEHLRALMAITGFVQEYHFEKIRMAAGSTTELRDGILRSNRKREFCQTIPACFHSLIFLKKNNRLNEEKGRAQPEMKIAGGKDAYG